MPYETVAGGPQKATRQRVPVGPDYGTSGPVYVPPPGADFGPPTGGLTSPTGGLTSLVPKKPPGPPPNWDQPRPPRPQEELAPQWPGRPFRPTINWPVPVGGPLPGPLVPPMEPDPEFPPPGPLPTAPFLGRGGPSMPNFLTKGGRGARTRMASDNLPRVDPWNPNTMRAAEQAAPPVVPPTTPPVAPPPTAPPVVPPAGPPTGGLTSLVKNPNQHWNELVRRHGGAGSQEWGAFKAAQTAPAYNDPTQTPRSWRAFKQGQGYFA